MDVQGYAGSHEIMNQPTFVFRSDASIEIGAGHVMRCLTLAEVLKDSGARCIFLCKEHPGNLLQFIRERGFIAHGLEMSQSIEQDLISEQGSPSHAPWLGGSWQDDAKQTLKLINGESVDWLVVDHYALDLKWESELRKACGALMAIDDLADRIHSCDLLLDQNLGRTLSDYSSLVPKSCVTLIGPMYALLRPEFALLRQTSLSRRTSGVVRQILVSMGGVDKDNVTGKMLAALEKMGLPRDCKVVVVMGSTAPWLSEVHVQASLASFQVEVRENVSDMAQLMTESDLAIGAAGSTSWERCCLGLPSLVLVLAKNQDSASRGLEDCGAAIRLLGSEFLEQEIAGNVCKLVRNHRAVKALGIEAAKLVDGKGVGRVISAIENMESKNMVGEI